MADSSKSLEKVASLWEKSCRARRSGWKPAEESSLNHLQSTAVFNRSNTAGVSSGPCTRTRGGMGGRAGIPIAGGIGGQLKPSLTQQDRRLDVKPLLKLNAEQAHGAIATGLERRRGHTSTRLHGHRQGPQRSLQDLPPPEAPISGLPVSDSPVSRFRCATLANAW